MKNDTAGVCRRTFFSAIVSVSSASSASSRSFRTSARPFRGRIDAARQLRLRQAALDHRQAVAVGRDHAEHPVLATLDVDAREVEPGLVGRHREQRLVDHLAQRAGRHPQRDVRRVSAAPSGSSREVLRIQADDLELGSPGQQLDPARRDRLEGDLLGSDLANDLVELPGIQGDRPLRLHLRR